MKNHKMYEAGDKMISLIADNYSLLQSLSSFGINLGFGDKTVEETCRDNGVDTYTFLAVVNFTINGHISFDDEDRLSVPTLLHYLEASHVYYLDFQLPFIRKELTDAINKDDSLGMLIMNLYDEYAREIQKHMMYEERTLFPYVKSLMEGTLPDNYSIDTFSKHHSAADHKLKELKNIMYANLPSKLAALVLKPGLTKLKNMMDYKTIGGAPLLGISKPVIKAHGSSDARAFCSACEQAILFAHSGFIGQVEQNMEYMTVPVEKA